MKSSMLRTLSLFAGLFVLGGCTTSSKDPEFAVPVQSAVVEFREEITQTELDAPTKVVVFGHWNADSRS